jgi:two-component system, cell cycle sensor histidine kinase and response regulator CckA
MVAVQGVVTTSGGSRTGLSVLLVRSAAGWTAGTAALALAGWQWRIPALTRVLPTLPAMVPLTAAVLALAGAGLWLLRPQDAGPARRLAGRVAAVAVAGAGAAVLVEYAGAVDLGVDRLLFAGRVADPATGGGFPGRPSPHTAVAFLAAGLALLLLDARTRAGRRAASVLAPVTALTALTALLGDIYGVAYLRGLTPVTGMSVLTAVAVLVLAVGILAAREDRPIVRAFTGAGPGGTLVRRISPVLLGLPFAVGLIAAVGGRAEHDTGLAVTATTVTAFVALAVVVVPTALALEAAYSARLQLVAELRRQRDFDASLLASMHEAVIVLDHRLCIVDANPRFCEMLGRPRGEVIGVGPPWPWWPAAEADRLAGPLSALQEHGHRLTAETVLHRPDGSEVMVLVHGAPLPGSGADGPLLLFTLVDITDRKRAEAKLRGLLDAAPDAVIGVDACGVIALVNAQVERLFGYRRDQLLGQQVEILVPATARDGHPAHRHGYFTDPRPRAMGAGLQVAGRRRDGSQFPAEVSLSALHTEDGLLVSAAVRDVTNRVEAAAERERLRIRAERDRLEGQLHQSQRLESLGQLAGGVAHDFNNLLAVILNYAAFVEEEVSTAADQAADQRASRWPQVRGDVEQIRRAAERATALTHQLLAFGRREVVQPRVLDLNDVVRDIEQLLRRTLGEHIQLDTALAADLRPVLADPGQIEQVLVNLAVNARDAMPTGGVLTVATANTELDHEQAGLRPGLKTGPHVRLRVSDIGAGMPREVLERAFEPFFTTKPKGEGSGLGLATIYGIITQAEGHTEIESAPGRGTTFTALLPVTDRMPAPAVTAAALPPARGGETILVVEDEDAMREVTRRILARNGYEVLTAARGADALTLAAATDRCIHLLITDVIMPQMLGNDVADRLRATRPGIHTLFMSGYAHSVLTSAHTLEPGVTLIEKPFTESALLAKVRQVLDGRDEPGPDTPERAAAIGVAGVPRQVTGTDPRR